MSVKLALLALLGTGPQGVYSLRNRFEDVTGGAWPLNIGQVYTTIGRLERDGLVKKMGTEPSHENGRPDIELFALTEKGLGEVTGWWRSPVDRSKPSRDEFTIKVAVAATTGSKLLQEVIDVQRFNLMQTLQDINRQRREIDSGQTSGLALLMTIDRQQFLLEAEIRWLDHLESGMLQKLRKAERADHQSKTPKESR